MTGHDQTPGWDVHALSGAYAVDALDDAERARFEDHLAHCAECRDEVDGMRESAAVLGAVGPVEPPAALRDRVLEEITQIRPLPPLSTPAPGGSPVELGAARRRLRPHRSGRTGHLLLVAAVLVLVAAAGGLLLRPWADDNPDKPNLTAAERVLAADDATSVDKRFPDGSTATIVVSRTEGRAVIRTTDMAPAPDGKVYELWLQTPAGEMERAGLMPDLRDATVLLDGDASRATGVGITVEPDGGSDQPTSEPIAFFTLDS
ncbi:anti-sigma factor [Nocardioides daeguensis]|uniref:Anti-sigma factor n=1 Tax=Nocardioides daeguensis TaxID=908359 RepID=A0ABP6VG17_9ACTN|nr:anti-sigma factor [Nocardioides daeguensis]MBV6728921.1 anti-sigma factor [Nocardioides daeguensis]MCR1773442.1 anti-sigma factor [Nocardioides daeguensis]